MSTQTTNPVQVAVGRLAALQRRDRAKDVDPQVLAARIADARNALVAARAEREIVRAVSPSDPDYEPLRREDRERLAALLLA